MLTRRKGLTRKTPLRSTSTLKRSGFIRRKRRPNPAGDDPIHLAIVRSLNCEGCGRRGPNDPHHLRDHTGAGRKESDLDTLSLCRRCHDDLPASRGRFAGWTKEQRKEFERAAARRTRMFAEYPVLMVVRLPDRWSVYGAYASEDEALRIWMSKLGAYQAWWGDRREAARLVTDPTAEPTERKSA